MSLQKFFDQAPPATLDNCDREPIHLTGRIQSIGALLVLDRDGKRIIGGSTNASAFLGSDISQAIGQPLSTIHADLHTTITDALQGPRPLRVFLDDITLSGETAYEALAVATDSEILVEFLPAAQADATALKRKMRQTARTCSAIHAAKSVEEAQNLAVEAIQDLTGFDRVKMYEFQPDWSGKVVAESRADETMASYLGLYFPDTDIPKQARALFSLVPWRGIASTQEDATMPIIADAAAAGSIDLSHSILRSVSPIHLEYLRNMGLGASFSASLMLDGRLWGLIACHHRHEHWLSFDEWALVEDIGMAVVDRIDREEDMLTARNLVHMRQIEHSLAAEMRRRQDISSVIEDMIPSIQEFLRADGFAFVYGNDVYTSGFTPPISFIRQLIGWAESNDRSDQFATTQLHAVWPAAQKHMETACGVLLQPIAAHRICQMVWFRRPMTEAITWAGKPEKIIDKNDPHARLMPRASFDAWTASHHDQSLPWRKSELESAKEVLKEILDIVASQLLLAKENEELKNLKEIASQLAVKEENEAMKRFIRSAVHDLKAPLRGINLALDMMREDGFDPESVDEAYRIASTSSKRLSTLTSDILELASTMNSMPKMKVLSLDSVVRRAVDMLSADINQARAAIEIGPLPDVRGDRDQLLRLFENLFSNALKYRSPGRALLVQVEGKNNGDMVKVRIADNGIGVAENYADRIFQPFQRLHNSGKIEGSGLGLSICRQIAHAHDGSITLDATHQSGVCMLVTLPGADV